MDTNEQKQNELMNAVGAQAPTLYSGQEIRVTACTAKGKTAMIAVGNDLMDDTVAGAARDMNQRAAEFAAKCVNLGLLCQAKKEALDARGNNQYSDTNGEGFESWCERVLVAHISTRQLRRYMEVARQFLVDFEAVCGEVPADTATLEKAVAAWCGERTLAQIRKEIRAEQSRKELKASPDAAPEAVEEPESSPDPQATKAETLLKFNKILDRVLERDNELRSAFEQAAPELNNAETTQYLEALAKHYSDLFGFYDGLVQKAKQVATAAA